MLLHIDTDFGGDPDDACALAMLLGVENVEISGITTNLDEDGRRAGCVDEYLRLAQRSDIPVAAGSGATLTNGRRYRPTVDDGMSWPNRIDASPSTPGDAMNLLMQSIRRGATIVAIGSLTNLAMLEIARPGALDGIKVVAMAGWVIPPAHGLPAWGPETDFNVQCDTRAAEILFASGAEITLVTLPATIEVHLRGSELQRLRSAGPVGELLARQSEVHASASNFSELARAHEALPDDLINFHWDPVTCAVAIGWNGTESETMSLQCFVDDGILHFAKAPDAKLFEVVTSVDAEAFAELWLSSVESIRNH